MLVVVALVASLAVVAVPNLSAAGAQTAPGASTYYLDSVNGSDANDGVTPVTPWRSLGMVQEAPMGPGTTVMFKRGGSWDEEFTISASGTNRDPIVIGSFGRGALPRFHTGGCLDLNGSYIVVERVQVDSCEWAGLSISGNNNTVRYVVATGNVTGIYVRPGAMSNRLLTNELRDNNRMSVLTTAPGDDSGAWGVLLRGDDTEVAYNQISGSDAFSYDFVRDGAAIEVYGGQRNQIHHNQAVDNNMFSELGHPRSANNVFSYNVVVSRLERGGFLTTRGAKSGYGPVMATELYNNSVYLAGSVSEGFVCHAGCGPEILKMRNNVIQAVQKAGYADAPFDDGNGIYFGGRIQFEPGPGSQVVEPGFVDAARGNLRLVPSSPGIDQGTPDASEFDRDIVGTRVPVDGDRDGVAVIDVGAYELR